MISMTVFLLLLVFYLSTCRASRTGADANNRRRLLLSTDRQHIAFLSPRRRTLLYQHPMGSPLQTLECLRGGAAMQLDVLDVDDDDKEESESEDEEDSDDGADENPLSSVISMEPVPVTIRTSLGVDVIDQSVELTVHRSRDVASLKQSISRLLPGRPPIAIIQLRLDGRTLDDELLVDELVDDEEEEDMDDDDEDGDGKKLILQLDMVPPVDPKFVAHLEQRLEEMSLHQILDAYTKNEAAIYVNSQAIMQPIASDKDEDDTTEEDIEEGDNKIQSWSSTTTPSISVTLQLKENAERIRRELEETILNTDHAKKLLAESLEEDSKHHHASSSLPNLQERQVRGQRVRQAAQGGVRTTFKRKIQRNLNVSWADTLRHFALFLFFGYFGGRTPLSRAILLLGAPSVFLLQARPVKLLIRQAWYTIADHPPSIFLSLLPAPHQAILSLDVGHAMKTIYGDFAVVENNLLDEERSTILDAVDDGKEEDFEEVSEDYSDDYDEEYEDEDI